jgi:hypothetical protein
MWQWPVSLVAKAAGTLLVLVGRWLGPPITFLVTKSPFLRGRIMSEDLVPLGNLQPLSGHRNSLIVSEKKKKGGELTPQVMNLQGLQTRPTGTVLQVRPRDIDIDGQIIPADPYDLIAVIKNLTQQIGDWKKMDNLMGKYMIVALRSARTAAVSDLKKFGIHWQIDKTSGESHFWL